MSKMSRNHNFSWGQSFTFDELRKAALEVKAEALAKGRKPKGIRKKPRTKEEYAAMSARFDAKLEKYPPRIEIIDGVEYLILPYFD